MTGYDYKKAWNQVNEFESKGLPESALKVVNEIYQKAKAENNSPQLVKAVIHQFKFTEAKEENAFITNIQSLEKEIQAASFPLKGVLHSMLAEMYWKYYENNRWRFRNRTETVNFNNADMATWTLEKIVSETFRQYQLSLQEIQAAQKIDINVYDEVTYSGNSKGKVLRPTLFDFLAHRALAFYINQETAITKPAYAFTLYSPDYLAEATAFTQLKITSPDTLSQKLQALQLFQELLRFHLKDEKPDALVSLDLERLAFVRQNLVLSDKTERYLQALQQLEQKYLTHPASTLVTHAVAQVWVEKGNQYKPLQGEAHQFDLRKAYEICETAKKRFPESDGAILCHNIQVSLENKNIGSKLEKINEPNQPFRAWVSYQNFQTLYWRIIPVTREEVKAQRKKWQRNYDVDQEEKFIQWFAAKTPLKSGNYTLPDDKDYQSHSVEIKLDAVSEGEYMVLFSHTADFKTTKNGLAYAFTTISNLSYIHRNLVEGATEFYVLHRQTGEPLAGVNAQVYTRKYDSRSGEYVFNKENNYVTDAKGRFVVPYRNSRQYDDRNFQVEFRLKNDFLSTRDIDDQNYYGGGFYQYPRSQPSTEVQTLFFLDRAIYRPGQTVYFKGLTFSTTGKNPVILPKRKATVQFYDVNHQLVAEKEVVTNEFGTFSGTFTTPTSGLMGQMVISMDDETGQVYFSVEEYKRPKFEVKFNPVKGSFRLNETVQTEGVAQAYSGALLDNVQVAYRVVRTARFPIWWWYRWGYYPTSPEMEITNGIAQTDVNGKFQISFKAIPDASIDSASNPTFDYKVYADVTDVNGETHSAEQIVSVGYRALEVGVDLKDIDKADSKLSDKKWNIRTTNLAGEFEPAKGTITIWKLKSPNRVFRTRMWERPDKHVFTQDQFYAFFPHDLYTDELNIHSWEKEKEVVKLSFDTEKSKEFLLSNLKNWDLGQYQVQIDATDKYGQPVKEVVYFEVFHSESKTVALPFVQVYKELKTTAEPGEKARLLAGTADDKLRVLYEVEQEGNLLSQEWLTLSKEQSLFEIPITEAHRGNIAVHYTFVQRGRLYHETTTISVPYTNKQLDISFESFRDKLQPGQKEDWKIKIAAHKADKVMAEMVATLYDASLDAFRVNSWYAQFYHTFQPTLSWQSTNGFEQEDFREYQNAWSRSDTKTYYSPDFKELNWFGYYFGNSHRYRLYEKSSSRRGIALPSAAPRQEDSEKKKVAKEEVAEMAMADSAVATEGDLQSDDKEPVGKPKQDAKKEADFGDVKVRSNFNETAFFYPHLQTNEKGELLISFTVPEALTRWKMLGFAHTQQLQSGSVLKELVTQKDLMVVPNQPRFFRENDKMVFAVKITSLADKDLTGQAQLEFFDALTMQSIDSQMKNSKNLKDFSVKAKQSTSLEWSIEIPEGIQAIAYKVVAKAGSFSDGETMTLPVVTNRMLVTETLPLPIRGNQTKEFRFEKLITSSSSRTLRNHKLTLEFTSNPAWYAVQALPYLMEYPYECTEQLFSRYYANSLATHIANSNPKIKRVFDVWKNFQPDALLSNLEKNQELKSALLEETPWVLQAKDESQRKRNVALLFDLNRMADEQGRALDKIQKAQLSSGGFSWFPGMPEDRFMTQHIVAGMGHLDVLGVKSVRTDAKTWEMIQKALGYLDDKMTDDYQRLKAEAKRGRLKLEDQHVGYFEYHYLYTRSYFKDQEINSQHREAFDYYLGQTKKYWLQNTLYTQGMIALALHRFNDKVTPAAIMKSLNEKALHSDEMGMYWKSSWGYYWYQAPIETQALMIEVYDEVAQDQKAVEELKIWLLKQKQTQDWKTTKATAEACYALLRRGTDALADERLVEVTLGKEKVDPLKQDATKPEAGTGYFKVSWTGNDIKPDMGKVTVHKPSDGVAWGAVYWQYFEQLDKITPAETPLKLKKQLFLQQNTDRGPVITPVTDQTVLKVGDLVKVRIELRSDRNMEYVHLKDMRAAGFEPVETISQSKYQDGLWYYESPRDLATNFFMGYLPKGTYVFEYSLRVSQKGDFSNGITTIQCMYAPEFASHSEGIRVKMGK